MAKSSVDDSSAAVPDPTARSASEWFQVLYGELRRRARGELFRHQAVTIGPTTLLHEAWLRLGRRDDLRFASQAELVCYASRAMRGIVIDHIRARIAGKRGSGQVPIPYETLTDLCTMPATAVLSATG